MIVLPWHDPMRVAEQITLLDNLSDGRMILGIGRGLARVEYEGFRVDMNTSRERFVEYAEAVLEGLERGYMEYDDELRHAAPARAPAPPALLVPGPHLRRRGVARVDADHGPARRRPAGDPAEAVGAWCRRTSRSTAGCGPRRTGTEPPPPLSGGFVVVHENADRAEEMARR